MAEKTGYPARHSGSRNGSRSDLGIDSIKRVQILAAVHDARPGLPEVDAQRMAGLRTLAEIMEYLGTHIGKLSRPGDSPNPEEVSKISYCAVVAEKTGYPRDILALDMDLEADLGIDSIKRVQILSADMRRAARSAAGRCPGDGDVAYARCDSRSPEGASSAAPGKPFAFRRIFLSTDWYVWECAESTRPERARRVCALFRVAQRSLGHRGDGLTGELAQSLGKRGLAAIAAENAEDIAADADITIFVDSANVQDSLADCAERAFQAARSFGASRGARGGVFITVGWGPSALRAGLAALVKTVALEYPQCSAKAIEIESGFRSVADAAETITSEILSGERAAEVMLWQDGSRGIVEEIALPIGHDHDMSLRPIIP